VDDSESCDLTVTCLPFTDDESVYHGLPRLDT
jgi:hypothetical protein